MAAASWLGADCRRARNDVEERHGRAACSAWSLHLGWRRVDGPWLRTDPVHVKRTPPRRIWAGGRRCEAGDAQHAVDDTGTGYTCVRCPWSSERSVSDAQGGNERWERRGADGKAVEQEGRRSLRDTTLPAIALPRGRSPDQGSGRCVLRAWESRGPCRRRCEGPQPTSSEGGVQRQARTDPRGGRLGNPREPASRTCRAAGSRKAGHRARRWGEVAGTCEAHGARVGERPVHRRGGTLWLLRRALRSAPRIGGPITGDRRYGCLLGCCEMGEFTDGPLPERGPRWCSMARCARSGRSACRRRCGSPTDPPAARGSGALEQAAPDRMADVSALRQRVLQLFVGLQGDDDRVHVAEAPVSRRRAAPRGAHGPVRCVPEWCSATEVIGQVSPLHLGEEAGRGTQPRAGSEAKLGRGDAVRQGVEAQQKLPLGACQTGSWGARQAHQLRRRTFEGSRLVARCHRLARSPSAVGWVAWTLATKASRGPS